MNIQSVAVQEFDRVDFILELIGIWREKDPRLEDVDRYRLFIEKAHVGRYPVLNTKLWLKYSREARKKRYSVAELLFIKSRTVYTKKSRDQIVVDVLGSDKITDLREMSERIRKSDPMRTKT